MTIKFLQGHNVLVVDDEHELREIICDEFKDVGATTFEAADGLEALNFLENNTPFSIVISYIRMPKCSGDQLLIKTRKLEIKQPAFFFTTGYSDISETSLISYGALGVLKKPINFPVLFELVKKVLIQA